MQHSSVGELHYLPIEHNLEYAQNHFAGADMSDYFTKVICGCAALINPDRVVLYADPRLADKASQICVSCAQVLPEQAMPVIELSRSFEQDYTEVYLPWRKRWRKPHEILCF